MKSARSFSEHEIEDYCVHQRYQKSQKFRNSQIAYNIFPKQNLNSMVNVHRKCTNQYSYNFDTLAYQKFVMGKQPETENQRNFVKNYYLQNVPEKLTMTNEIVKELENQVFPFNAYNLAEGATKDYYAFQYKRQQYLIAARKRAKNNSKAFAAELKEQAKRNFDERQKWIQKILLTLQDLGQRMFSLSTSNKQNESQNGKQRIFLNQKSYVNQKYLRDYKIRDPETSKRIFEDLRVIMLRKKRNLQDERIKQKNANLTMSQINETQSSVNSVSQSIISVVSEAEREKEEEKMISELCDFQGLKKKWRLLDVERIKDIILSTLTRKIILSCEADKAKRLSSKRREYQSIPAKFDSKKGEKLRVDKRNQADKKKQTQDQTKVITINKSKLTKQELQTKQNLMKTSQFDVPGIKYEHARKFSDLFKRKQKDISINFTFTIQKQHQNEVSTARGGMDSLHSDPKAMKGYKTTRATSLRM